MRRSIIRFVALFSLMMLDVLGGASEAAAGYAFAVGTAETGVGIAAGVAVGLHGTDVAYAGYRTMMNGASYDSLTSRGLQAAGVPQGWVNGLDAGISIVGSAGIGMAASRGGEVVVANVSRVRHHTSALSLDEIKLANSIFPARGNPIGVHVEMQPFGAASSASRDVGAFGRGAYIEFDQPQNIIPTYVGPRHTGVIPTETPLNLEGLNPVFHR